jgi:hypothetical protein
MLSADPVIVRTGLLPTPLSLKDKLLNNSREIHKSKLKRKFERKIKSGDERCAGGG